MMAQALSGIDPIPQLFIPLVLLLGLVWGSFCNVLVARLPMEQGISGRSHCPHCSHILSWQDLIPVVSYLILGGRCRYCSKPISPRYLVVEVTCALLFFLAYTRTGQNLVAFVVVAFYLSLSLVIFFTDLEHAVIPNSLVVPGILVALASAIFHLHPSGPSLALSVLGGLIGGGTFMVIYWLTRGTGMGMGDVKLAFFMGLALGPLGLLLTILVGSVSGLVLAGFVMWRFKKELASLESVPMHMDQEDEPDITERVWGMMVINGRPAVPFGSFLSLGFTVTLVWLEALFLTWLI